MHNDETRDIEGSRIGRLCVRVGLCITYISRIAHERRHGMPRPINNVKWSSMSFFSFFSNEWIGPLTPQHNWKVSSFDRRLQNWSFSLSPGCYLHCSFSPRNFCDIFSCRFVVSLLDVVRHLEESMAIMTAIFDKGTPCGKWILTIILPYSMCEIHGSSWNSQGTIANGCFRK